MANGRVVCVMALCLLGNALSVPLDSRRLRKTYDNNEVDSDLVIGLERIPTNSARILSPVASNYGDMRIQRETPDPFDGDDDGDVVDLQTSSTGGGSNILSLLSLVSGMFPGSSGSGIIMREMIRQFLRPGPGGPLEYFPLRRQDVNDNVIDIDYTFDLKPPPFQRQESEESDSDSDSHASESDENNAEEESAEDNKSGNASQQNSEDKADDDDDDDDDDYDSDEPPGGGDGQGGGILGILAGLSGGEDGQSDLGSLLATVSGIVVNLSGDGFDFNSLIASALGLFVGLLSEGEENPGEIIASYLLTSLDTITGGGSKNNGEFFGKLLSKLISGTSAGEAPESGSNESGEPQAMKDSAGFLISLLMGLSGEMSKGSSKGSSSPW